MNLLYRTYSWIVWIISVLTLSALFVAALLFTCTLSQDSFETTYFMRTNALSLILACFFFAGSFAAFLWIDRRFELASKLRDRVVFARAKHFMIGTLAALLAIWVISTQVIPISDQLLVQNAATAISKGDFSMFQDGNYIGTYPFQLGLVWFSCVLGLLFGFDNYLAFQFVNIFAYIGIFCCLMRLGEKLGVGRVGQLCILLLAFLFYPFAFMVSFVYGNLIGLFFALLAIVFELRFFETACVRYAISSALAISFAIFIKANYQVCLIGMVLTALVYFLKERTAKVLLLVALCLIGFGLQGAISTNLGRMLSGESLDQGVGAFAYVAMGLHDDERKGPEDFRAPGWYDASTITAYEEVGYDSELLKQRSLEDIRSSLESYLHDPSKGIVFFGKKFVSQWCNPDFQGVWNVRVKQTDIQQPAWTRIFTSDSGQRVLRYYLKALQLCIEFLALFCLLRNRKSLLGDNANMILMLILVGGLLCHMVWEAKAQYTVTYYVLLFPYAAKGAQDLSRIIRRHVVGRNAGELGSITQSTR